MRISIVLPLRNQDQLAALLNRLYDPKSPYYRHFVSVDQFTDQFGPTSEDYQKVVDFARENGFAVDATAKNRLVVPISGTVDQIQKTFSVTISTYWQSTENRKFYSADKEPTVALDVPIAHVSGLNNYSMPKPQLVSPSLTQSSAFLSVTGSGPGGSYLSSDMRAAYYGGSNLTGAGQTVALVQFDGYDIDDVVATFGGTATAIDSGTDYVIDYTPASNGPSYSIPIHNVLLDGATGAPGQFQSQGDVEQAVDIVQAIGMAPGLSQVRVYIGAIDVDILNAIASEDLAKQISISWAWVPEDPGSDDPIFQEFAAQGQSVFVASGDGGNLDAFGAYYYPATDAWVAAVGGTDLITNSAGGGWLSETAWSRSGGGISPDGTPMPSWQAGLANSSNGASNTFRDVPDLAMEANNDNYACNLGTCSETWGGTSFAAPRWAGFTALVNQQSASGGYAPIGFPNPMIYGLSGSQNGGNLLHDVVVGNNDTPDVYGIEQGFNAVAGYDLVTGWGSPNGQTLIDAMAPPLASGFQISTSPTNITIAPGNSASVQVAVHGTGGFNGVVNLSTATLPPGIAASFNPTSTTGSSTLTISVGSNVMGGAYALHITGTSGSMAASVSVALVVDGPSAKVAITAPAIPIAPITSQEFKPGASIPISGIVLGGYQNLAVQWAEGINPASGWSAAGVTLNEGVTDGTLATWDTSSISSADYYTIRLSAEFNGITSTSSTTVYLDPNLFTANWPQVLDGEYEFTIAGWSLPTLHGSVPFLASDGSARLALTTDYVDLNIVQSQVRSFSPDGSSQISLSHLTFGSLTQPAAGNLDMVTGDAVVSTDYGSLSIFHADGTKSILAPPPVGLNLLDFSSSQPILDDLDGDSLLEVLALGSIGSLQAYGGQQAYLYAWRNTGQLLNANFPITVADVNQEMKLLPFSRFVVGDIDGDGKKEIVILAGTSSTSFTPLLFAADGTSRQWGASTISSGDIPCQMLLADLDHNGKLETIIYTCGANSTIYVLQPDGSERPGWPQHLSASSYYLLGLVGSIAVGDLNQDGNEEIVVSSGNGDVSGAGNIFIFNSDGTSFSNTWPLAGSFGPVLLADVTGSGFPEIVTSANTPVFNGPPMLPYYNAEQLVAIDRFGHTVRSWNLLGADGEGSIFNVYPTIGNFNNDGMTEIAVNYDLVQTLPFPQYHPYNVLTVLSTGTSYNPTLNDWPMFDRDPRNTSVLRRAAKSITTIASSSNPSNSAQPAIFTFTVAPAAQNGTMPTGVANLLDGSQNIGSCVLFSGTCSVTPTLAGGLHSLTAGYVGDTNFDVSYSSTITQTVNGEAQTITFANPGAQTVGTPLALTGSSTSGLTVGFASTTPSVCTVSGTTAAFIASGTCTIDATQAGNSTYAPAPMIAQSFNVNSVILSLNFNVSELSFGSEPLNTTSPAQTVILANPNAAAVAITSIDASGDFTANSNCPIIAAYSTCSVGVTFTPSATGARTGTLTVTSSGISPQSIQLSGTGTTAGIQVAPAAINFGSQAIGATSPGQTVIIQNTGNATLSVSNIAATEDFATSGSCSTVPAGSSCSLTVMFTPTAVGTRTGTLTLTDNAGGTGTSQAVSLAGIGTAAGASLSPSLLTFPATLVGATSFQINATLTNTGAADLTGISVLAQDDFTQANNCSSTLASNATCTISVKYVPSITGAETGSITVTDSLGSQNLPLAGSGIAPGVSLSTSELEFGGQLVTTTSQAQTAIVTNSGSAPLAIDSVQSSDNFSDTTNCSGTVPPGSSCSINIFFAPTAIGSLVGTLTVADSVGNQTINLQGLGNGAGLTITPSFAIFGAQPVNSSSQAQTLTAKNHGTTPLTLNPITVTGNFTESDNCPSQLQAGSSCAVSVTFSPSATGSLSGSVNISDTTGAATTMATVSGQGTLPGIAASPATLFFGSLPVGTTSQAQTITVTNTGTAPLQIGSVSGNGDFAETDTCADQTIAAGSLCLISVTMTPTTTGMRTGSIQIIDSADGSHIIALSGMGQATGVSVSPTTLAFGSAPVSGSAQGTSLQVTVTNTGTLPLTFSGASTRGDFTESDSCGTTIAVGASCLLSINFAPTGLGHRTGTLTISDDAGGGVQLVSLEGDGSPVGLALTPPVLTFATPKQGVTSAPQTVVLSNNTGASLANVAIAASGEYAESDNCGTTLLNGANCTVSITVTPAISGAITGTVTISSGGQISISSEAVRLRSSVTAASVSAAGTMSSSAVGVVALSTGTTAATPTFSVQPGNYNTAQTVTISDATPGATIYYATNANPTTSSMVYNGAIRVSSSETIEAIAVASGYAQSAVTTAAYTITLPTPAVTVTAASSSITPAQPLQVTVAVAGTPTPTGTVTLTSGPYSSSATTLSNGSATITIPAGSLVTGEDTLTAAYTPDATSSSTYNSATGTALVTVTVPPSFTLSASPTSMSVAQGASGTSTISVTDIGAFSGMVALAATGLPSGVTASFAAGTAAGTQVLTLTATNTAAVAGPVTITITGTSAELTASTTIALTITAEAAFTASGASGSDAPISIAPGSTTGNTSTISVKGTNGFSGTVNLACSISPAAASAPATCTLSPSSVTLSGNTAQTATLTVNSTAATSATNRGERLFWPAGGTALAMLLSFTVPRRRNWMTMLGLLVLLFSAGLSACGGGGSVSGGGGSGNSGTTPGTYTVTVTGTSGTISATVGTVTLTVQ